MTAISLKTAIDTAVTRGEGHITLAEAAGILSFHGVEDGYMTVVIDKKLGVEDDYFVDLITIGQKVTGVKITRDTGQFL